MEEAILEVKNLKTYFYNDGKELRASDDLSYQVHKGECVAIIGESGSGKTVEALSILRLIPYPPGLIVDGQILFHGQDLLQMSDQEMRQIRGSKISMIFQEASTALDPVMTIGNQIAEALRIHKGMKKKEALEKAPPNRPYWKCSPTWASTTPSAAISSIPMSSPAVCASGP